MLTSYYITAPLSARARALKQRVDSHAQKEIQELAIQWNNILTRSHGDAWNKLIQ